MDTISAIRSRIFNLCEENHITINELASISRLSFSSIRSILYGSGRNYKLETIKAICDGFGITFGAFFSSPEFDNLEQSI